MKHLLSLLICLLLLVPSLAAAQDKLTPEQEAEVAKLIALRDSLRPQHGTVALPEAKATLNLGEAYYFLGAADAKRVLTEGWGNPPTAADGVLGMIFPAGTTFLDDAWGGVVTFEGTNYVPDDKAGSEDYDKVMREMQAATAENNDHRKSDGFEPISLIGWAQPPTYDGVRHDLVWAREMQFGAATDHTLNYDVRHLGRHGVLSINLVSSMSKLADVRPAAKALAGTAEFNAGARYADFQAGDKKAEYGLAGLVAAGAGLAVAQKAGALAVLLLVLKKGAVIFIAGFAGLGAWFKNRFRKKPAAPDTGSNIVE